MKPMEELWVGKKPKVFARVQRREKAGGRQGRKGRGAVVSKAKPKVRMRAKERGAGEGKGGVVRVR